MATAKAERLKVLDSFVAKIDGAEVLFKKDETIDPDHPAVRKHPHLFGPADSKPDIEQATAGPGEKRGAK